MKDQERKKLGRFVQNQYPTLDPLAIKIHTALNKLSLTKKEHYQREQLLKLVFGKKPVNLGHFRVARSQLKHAIENFLVIQAVLKAPKHEYEQLLFNELLSRKCITRASKSFDYWQELKIEEGLQSAKLLESAYRLGELAIQYHETLSHHEKTQATLIKRTYLLGNDNLKLKILFHAVNGMAMAKTYGNDYGVSDYSSEKMLNEINEQSPLILQLYKECYQIYQSTDVEDSLRFYYRLKQCREKLEFITAFALLSHAENRLIQFVNAKKIKNGFEILGEHYKYRMQQDMIGVENRISPVEYNNIFLIAVERKDYTWALAFANQYKSYLPSEISSDVYNIALAQLHFSKEEFEEVLERLKDSKIEYGHYGIYKRGLILRSLYKLGETEAVLNLAQTYSRFLVRIKDVGEDHRRRNLNAIHLLQRLVQLNPLDRIGLQKLKKAIEEADCNYQAWLLKQIEDIEEERRITKRQIPV